MQQGCRRVQIRCCWVFPSALTLGLGGWSCGGDAGVGPTPPAATPGAMTGPVEPPAELPEVVFEVPTSTEVPAPPPPALTEVGTCSRDLPACESGSTAACTLRCGMRADGCAFYSEFVPLGTVDPSTYAFRFGAIDPAGQWALYSRDWIGGRYESTPSRWSAADGIALLSDALGVPPPSGEYESLAVVDVAASGNAMLLRRLDTDDPITAYLWTRDQGLSPLDFEARDMSADGGVVVGLLANRAVIWDRVGGTRRLDGGALDEPAAPRGPLPDGGVPTFVPSGVGVSDSGQFVVLVGLGGAGYRWSEAQGSIPFESLPGFPDNAEVTLADDHGRILVASTRDDGIQPLRLWRWSDGDGAVELGTSPELPSESSYLARYLRAEGRVIVGNTRMPDGGSTIFRWSDELGMQAVGVPGKASFPTYVNADATTIIGVESTTASSFRWTARAGSSDVPGLVNNSAALGGDVLVAQRWTGDHMEIRVLKYDGALEMGALPIELIEAGVVPEGYVSPIVAAVSENARLLVGTADAADGLAHGWLLRLHDTCSP